MVFHCDLVFHSKSKGKGTRLVFYPALKGNGGGLSTCKSFIYCDLGALSRDNVSAPAVRNAAKDHTEHVCVALTPQNETFLPFLIIVSVEASKPDPNRPSFPPAWTLVADGGSRGQGGQSHTALWVRGQ